MKVSYFLHRRKLVYPQDSEKQQLSIWKIAILQMRP